MSKIIGNVVLAVIALSILAVLSFQSSEDWTRGDVLRTPDAAFVDLEGYPFQPNYIDSLGYRIHYVDEGPTSGPVLLLMHGQPTWSSVSSYDPIVSRCRVPRDCTRQCGLW